jgi:uncharacterized membrane protein (UPF0127 family)
MSCTAYVIFPSGASVCADVADSDERRARGLMFRASLGQSEGMLFVFDVPGPYAFWMKNVRVPLDIIWLDRAHRVVHVVESAPPCAGEPCPIYQPEADAWLVVEVAGGFVRRHAVAVGDTVTISRPSSSFRTATPDRC